MEQYKNKYLAFCDQKFQRLKEFQKAMNAAKEEELRLEANFTAYKEVVLK